MKNIKTTLLLVILCHVTLADLPVHCVKHQVVGKWKLLLGSATAQGVGMVPCGHEVPDRPETSYTAGTRDFRENMSLTLTLDG